MGGYYSYSAQLSTGEVANGHVQYYAGSDPVVVHLNVETATTETPIVPYSDESLMACFDLYTQKAEAMVESPEQ